MFGDAADRERLVDAALARFGRIDVLVNNAGLFEPRPFLEVDEAYLDRELPEVNNLLYFDKTNLKASAQALDHRMGFSQPQGQDRRQVSRVRRRPKRARERDHHLVLSGARGRRCATRFAPGHLTFELTIPGRSKPWRTYSLSESPNPDYYRVNKRGPRQPSDRT